MNQIDIDTIPYNSTGTSTTLPNNNNSNFDGGVGVTDDHNNNHDNNNDNNDNNNASKKSRKPVNYAFTQQRLRAWQPILRPPYVIAAFLILTAIFIPLGVVLLLASKSVIEYTVPYTNSCTMTRNETLGGAMHCEATIPFTVLKTMKPPVYIYYKLENFFQNHRRYAESRSDDQLSGNANSKKASVSDSCSPIVTYGSKGPVINPCGLIAWSMFNDTFTLTTTNTSATGGGGGGGSGGDDDDDTIVVCDTVTETGCTKKGISWSSDRSVKFRPPKTTNFTNWMHPLTYYNESSHVIPEVTDEDFIVWMRTAALPNFRKLHRIIKTTVHPGKYELHVNQNFPVTQFSGKKSFVMTTSSWIGGKNYFLAIAYLVVGGVCFVLAIIFAVGMVVQKIIAASNNRTA